MGIVPNPSQYPMQRPEGDLPPPRPDPSLPLGHLVARRAAEQAGAFTDDRGLIAKPPETNAGPAPDATSLRPLDTHPIPVTRFQARLPQTAGLAPETPPNAEPAQVASTPFEAATPPAADLVPDTFNAADFGPPSRETRSAFTDQLAELEEDASLGMTEKTSAGYRFGQPDDTSGPYLGAACTIDSTTAPDGTQTVNHNIKIYIEDSMGTHTLEPGNLPTAEESIRALQQLEVLKAKAETPIEVATVHWLQKAYDAISQPAETLPAHAEHLADTAPERPEVSVYSEIPGHEYNNDFSVHARWSQEPGSIQPASRGQHILLVHPDKNSYLYTRGSDGSESLSVAPPDMLRQLAQASPEQFDALTKQLEANGQLTEGNMRAMTEALQAALTSGRKQ